MASESDLDRSARELYELRYPHACGKRLTLADVLRMRAQVSGCPYCGGLTLIGLAPDIDERRAAGMLAELRARRHGLGLER